MNTPITDDAWYHNADHISAVDASLARLLETDRSALMAMVKGAEMHLSRLYSNTVADECNAIQDDGWILLCQIRSALAASRANFPTL